MKRIEFRLTDRVCDELADAADSAGVSIAEFVRQSVAEKLDREQVSRDMQVVRQEIEQLLFALQEAHVKQRRELAEDAMRVVEKQRQEAGLAMQKTQELNKSLVIELAKQLGGGAPRPTHSDPSGQRTDWSQV